MISRKDILMGRDVKYPLNDIQEANLQKLLTAIEKFEKVYWPNVKVSSGYRPAAINETIVGAAKKSNHIQCLAVDLLDVDGSIDKFCMKNLDLLEQIGLWLEHPDHTPGWCHLQVVPPKSGKRVFIP